MAAVVARIVISPPGLQTGHSGLSIGAVPGFGYAVTGV